jgi:acetoin utilization deacetylase AcuC-like enzyme
MTTRPHFLYHPRYLDHETGSHPERKERLLAIVELLKSGGLYDGLEHVKPRPATSDEICMVHEPEYNDYLAGYGGGYLDMDTVFSPQTYEVALCAAGGCLETLKAVVETGMPGFAAIRPPGHHAFPDRGSGFCVFNNVAVSARYAQREQGLERVLIFDWDVHHGNGTENIFYGDPSVLYCSMHQWPFYPGTGSAQDTGDGKGEGYTVNLPMSAGSGDADYLFAFDSLFAPIVEQFKPELVLVSAGYDCHRDDIIGGMRLSAGYFAAITQKLLDLAKKNAGGRVLALLEGGYGLEGLSRGVYNTLDAMAGGGGVHEVENPGEPSQSYMNNVEDAVSVQSKYWKM